MIFAGIIAVCSCNKLLDINKDPDRLPSTFTPYPQLLTSAQVNLGFEGGSDLFRYATLIMQQMSGLASQANQTWFYSRYNITGSDQNNVWNSIFATTLGDLELIIKQAGEAGSPHYVGVAKVLKAYEYSLVVDTWGDVPYTETQKLVENTQPHYDDDASIYQKLIALLGEAVTDLNATTSTLSPGTNSTFYTSSSWATAKPFWIKLANTLRLRLLLHYSKKDPAFCVAQMTALINTAGITFMSSNADNFQHPFYNVANQRSPISAFEVSRPDYLYADQKMVSIMNAKADPRRPYYFMSYPYEGIFLPLNLSTSAPTSTGNVLTFTTTTGAALGMRVSGTNIPANTTVSALTTTTITLSNDVTGTGVAQTATIVIEPTKFSGVSATAPPSSPGNTYSRIGTFLRGGTITGVVSGSSAPNFVYSGDAPQRMLTYTEYCFIRAEAALMGAPGDAQTWFTNGITASMQETAIPAKQIPGITSVQIANYLAANGTLIGTNSEKLKQIIEEKYIALFGVSVEPWTDWRRTGYPLLTMPANALNTVTAVPRTLFYPQSEIDLNPNCPGQKNSNLQDKVFWDQ